MISNLGKVEQSKQRFWIGTGMWWCTKIGSSEGQGYLEKKVG